jgi:predicted kinase/2'-5' RNA ligase
MNWYKKAQAEERSEKKTMYIMRGLPGSGKSSLADSIVGNGVKFGADDYFEQDGEYKFDHDKLPNAHLWTQRRASDAAKIGTSPIVIDNTNVTRHDIKPYVQIAKDNGYDIQIAMPKTPWMTDASELAKRNQHGASQEVIENMMEQWSPNVTRENLLDPNIIPPSLDPKLTYQEDVATHLEDVMKKDKRQQIEPFPVKPFGRSMPYAAGKTIGGSVSNWYKKSQVQRPNFSENKLFKRVEDRIEQLGLDEILNDFATQNGYDEPIDYLLCSLYPEYENICGNYYADEGPKLLEMISPKEAERIGNVLWNAVGVFNDQYQLALKGKDTGFENLSAQTKDIMMKEAEEQDYGWVCLDVEEKIAKKVLAWSEKNIPERELYTEVDEEGKAIHGDDWSYGLEDEIHITVKWGLTTKDADAVKDALESLNGGKVTLGKLGVFENDDYDVLKIDVVSPALRRLNTSLSDKLEHKDTFPGYTPHVTLAYLLRGNGEKYKGLDVFDGTTFEFDSVRFEDSDDKATTIKLSNTLP